MLAMAMICGVLMAGFVLMMLAIKRGTMAAPSLLVEIDADSIRLVDLVTAAPIASGPLQRAGIECATTCYRGRSLNVDVAALVLVVPGGPTTTLGTLTRRFTWGGPTRAVLSPDFLVSDGGWLALIDRLGLSSRLKVAT